MFALGADDIFVAVDKWKNARLEHKKASTQQIAAIALPDAAQSMFLTTSTTTVAFFGTAICPGKSIPVCAKVIHSTIDRSHIFLSESRSAKTVCNLQWAADYL